MSVRLRRPEDLPGCGRVLADVHAADAYPSRWPADTAAWLSPPGLAAAWIIEHDGLIAGHVGMVLGLEDQVVSALTGAPPHRLASVTRLFVAPVARGHKLGAALICTVAGHAVELGLQLMLDVVDDGGPAIALYERLDWQLVDRRVADWTTPEGRRLPVLVYLAPDGAGPAGRQPVLLPDAVIERRHYREAKAPNLWKGNLLPVPQDPFVELPVLNGQAVFLTPLGPDVDLDAYAAILGDPEVRFFTGTSRLLPREVLADWLASRPAQSNRADFAVHSAADGSLLGEAVLSEVNADSESAAYRVFLGPGARNRGAGTEVTRMVTDFAFSVGLHRVWLEVREDNPRARRTYEKCGYAVEGRLRDALLFDGQRVDMLVMAALAPPPAD